jgi:dUTP pyrophosphatase
MKVFVINKSKNPLPSYSTEYSAGLDLRADIFEPIDLQPLERVIVPTGLYIELPAGFEAQIRPRSGLAAKHGITVLNSPGTIDADYRGEIKIILVNLSNDLYTINPSDRIAQMIISKFEKIEFQLVEKLSETVRSEGGFGHTGLK